MVEVPVEFRSIIVQELRKKGASIFLYQELQLEETGRKGNSGH